MKTQKGFAPLAAVLILVIVGLAGGVGWYVSSHHKKTTPSTSTTTAKSTTATTTEAADPTADWISYSNTEGNFSLKHPKTWATATHPDFCGLGIFLIGADAKSVGVCASESFGQMSFISASGDSSQGSELGAGEYVSIGKSTVKVDGVTGIKMSGIASGQEAEGGLVVLPDGVKVTKYIFYTGGSTYTATYVAGSGYTDVLSDFNLLVTKTLKFSK